MNSASGIAASIQKLYNRLDTHLPRWMARDGVILLRVSLGVVFLWFGVLKFFPNGKPAGVEMLVNEPLNFQVPVQGARPSRSATYEVK